MEKEIKIASKLYECRDTAKSLAKMQEKDYKEMIAPYTWYLKEVMRLNKLEEIPALLRISRNKIYQESGMAQLMFMTATIELIEPSV